MVLLDLEADGDPSFCLVPPARVFCPPGGSTKVGCFGEFVKVGGFVSFRFGSVLVSRVVLVRERRGEEEEEERVFVGLCVCVFV